MDGTGAVSRPPPRAPKSSTVDAMPPPSEIAALLSAPESGSTCAAAGLAQRDLARCAARYPELFPARPFDPAFFSTITLANTFCAPWHTAAELRVANRITLWIFALDRLIDAVATSRAEVDDLVRRCLAVAGGEPAPAGDPLTAFLVEVRDELVAAPAYPALRAVWLDEVRRMLVTMAREWDWKGAPLPPSLDDYLDNAEFGFALVYVSHWIRTTPAGEVTDVAALRAAGWAVQRVIRLLNDLGTYHRDLRTGDLNALKLADRAEVDARIARETEASEALLAPLRATHPGLALFLARHIGFNTGFYRVTDYQGEL